ncbi:MAG: serine/threonine-protein phosphatase [Alistipes sp.]|nr:serine/threonine-protein phosphatase [Alistipes sp.]
MKLKLQACNIWELGQRARQEDSIFPPYGKITAEDRLFVLCDGMGGHDAGDIASSTVAEAMGHAILAHVPNAEGPFTDDQFREALSEAFDALDSKDNGAAKKMGTTMTFLKFHSGGCTIAHIGDSRVYHIRSGATAAETRILFQTTDHSLVNDLVRVGELTPEEAKTSPHKNVITRAMQPNMERRPKADIYHTSDLAAGDYFLMCSDGILEQMEDENLQYIFSEKTGNLAQKADMLIRVTEQNHDNHTAVLVRIDEVIGTPEVLELSAPQPERIAVMYGSPSPRPAARPTVRPKAAPTKAAPTKQPTKPAKPQSNPMIWLLILLMALLCGGGGFYLYTRLSKSDIKKEFTGSPSRGQSKSAKGTPKAMEGTTEEEKPAMPDAQQMVEQAVTNASEAASKAASEAEQAVQNAEQAVQQAAQNAEQAVQNAEQAAQNAAQQAEQAAKQAEQQAKETTNKLKQKQEAAAAALAADEPDDEDDEKEEEE